MKTLRLLVDRGDLKSDASRRAIAQAAEILRGGGTVAFPTETVYGLGANALDAAAVARIFVAKGRPSWDPLIVHIGDAAMLPTVAAGASAIADRLIDGFWPGPLTLLLPKSEQVPAAVTAGLMRVGVRMPAHPVAQALLRAAGVPVAAPSANRFGRTSATTAEHVAEDLNERIDAILDGGEATHGVESTVVDVRESSCVVYRPGVISLEQLREVCRCPVWIRESRTTEETAEAAAAPGMGERHYAPRARLILIEGESEAQKASLGATVRRCEEGGESVGVMLPDVFQAAVIGRQARVFRWGKWEDAEELAQRLYAGLRWLDSAGLTVIVCPLPAEGGLGTALRDRLQKAARR
ncbi:MAG: L-threonylcarbamoyladenylate synthase [Acidobacteriaceae bacterium]